MPYLGKGGTSLGINFGTAAVIMKKGHIKDYNAQYEYTVYYECDGNGVPFVFPTKNERWKVAKQENFAKIPGAPVAYWVSENVISTFEQNNKLDKDLTFRQGMTTTNNEKYLRFWHEVSIKNIGFEIKNRADSVKSKCVWFPYQKGGEYRKWYGNNLYIVYYFDDGKELIELVTKKYPKISDPEFIIKNRNWYFKEGLTWSTLTSAAFSARYCDKGFIFDAKGSMAFNKTEDNILYYIALLNSCVSSIYLNILSPTLDFNIVGLKAIPCIIKKYEDIISLTDKCIKITKSDWDAFETSWDFTKHPLVVNSGQLLVNRDSSANTQLTTTHYPLTTIAQAYQRWEEETNARFTQLKANEEELNRIFIDIYGLQDELTPEVEDKDVTVRKADLQRDIKSLLSYAVGCMFGRYSLDVEGLAYAGGEFSDQWVVISDQCYRREVVEKYVAQELQRAYGMAEVNVADGRDLSSSEIIAERGVIFTFGSDEKSSGVDSIKYRRGTSKKLYEGICELSFNSERIKCGIGNATYDLCSPEILNAITSGSGVELVQRGWQDADSIDWQTIHYKLKTNHYGADEDNVIPITDEDYFEDDIIGRLIAWLKVVYGAETLEENLRFIADALGTSGDTARQKIRNYFLKEFFKDHCKIYQKRPIYWLYDSGKQNGFKALIYMHRYNADTSGQVRAEYLGKMEETYESEINRMQDIMDNGAGREVALAGKRKEKLQKQLHECRDYDAVLGHIALASIAIDLDDGVKVNYVKVQTAKDGKLLPILAKI